MKHERRSHKDGRSRLRAWLHSNRSRCTLITLFGSLVILGLFYVSCIP